MPQHDNTDNTEKDDRQDRYQRKHSRAHENTPDHAPRRRAPYKREQVDYLQEHELEDEWFEHDN
jgi:hypothetical protein